MRKGSTTQSILNSWLEAIAFTTDCQDGGPGFESARILMIQTTYFRKLLERYTVLHSACLQSNSLVFFSKYLEGKIF